MEFIGYFSPFHRKSSLCFYFICYLLFFCFTLIASAEPVFECLLCRIF